jgi:hypothetical protein
VQEVAYGLRRPSHAGQLALLTQCAVAAPKMGQRGVLAIKGGGLRANWRPVVLGVHLAVEKFCCQSTQSKHARCNLAQRESGPEQHALGMGPSLRIRPIRPNACATRHSPHANYYATTAGQCSSLGRKFDERSILVAVINRVAIC